MNTGARIAALVVAVLTVSLGFILGLNVMKFDTTLHELAEDRAEIVLVEVGQTLQTAIDLGLSLEALDSGRTLREHAKAKDTAILDLMLFDAAGRVVDTGNAEMLKAPIPPAWLALHRRSGGESWSLMENGRLVMGIPLDTSLGVRAGGSVLVRSVEDEHHRVLDALAELAIAAVAILGVMIALALPACLLISRRLRRFLTALERRFAPDAAAGTDAAALPAALCRIADEFSSRARQIDDSIAGAEAEIRERVP